ncbi:hypothetical protein ANN_17395 [Periplaneta americana]|uniref:Uncharacterized protein n=1 Tax=Periplaneta americana TaxID=6978 RepID=A0ABQ8SSV1_PERAM|nr:hypothetical protein ANN_17395 [Periplaneta americana]
MAGLCEGGNDPVGSLEAICRMLHFSGLQHFSSSWNYSKKALELRLERCSELPSYHEEQCRLLIESTKSPREVARHVHRSQSDVVRTCNRFRGLSSHRPSTFDNSR